MNLLSRVYPYLKSKKWETRIAAARAVGGIVSHAELWDPNKYDENPKIEEIIEDDLHKINIKEENDDNENENENVKIEEDKIEDVKMEDVKMEDVKMEDADISIKNESPSIKSDPDRKPSPLNYDNLLKFSTFSISEILENGIKLLASGGNEYNDLNNNINNGDSDEALKKQKISDPCIKQGLSIDLGSDNKLLENEIITQPTPIRGRRPRGGKKDTRHIPTSTPPLISNKNGTTPEKPVTSARLRAMAKRKAKSRSHLPKSTPVNILQSSVSRRLENTQQLQSPNLDHQKQPIIPNPNSISITPQSQSNKMVIEHKPPEIPTELSMDNPFDGIVWPFQGIFELLLVDLFNQNWETRHGAALGLREIVKIHGPGVGRIKGNSKEQNDKSCKVHLEDLACRLLSLLALDRFGDYVSDQVIAPVRESATQTLGALLIHLNDSIVFEIFKVLYQLVMQKDICLNLKCWEASHAGMLGIRYLVSVRTDLLFTNNLLLDGVVEMVMHGLKEDDDDVQALSAATLIPIAEEFVRLKKDSVEDLINVIWNSLTDLKDDLSASIGNVMDLLGKLCAHKEVLDIMKRNASIDSTKSSSMLVPRLYPFMRHSITNVRRAVLDVLISFLMIDDENNNQEDDQKSDFKGWVNGRILRLIFQNLLVEQNEIVLNLSIQLFEKLINEISNHPNRYNMNETFEPHLGPMLSLLMTPIGVQRNTYKMNTNLFIRPSGAIYNAKEFNDLTNGNDDDNDDDDDDNNVLNGSGTNGISQYKKQLKRKRSIAPKTSTDISPLGFAISESDRINIDGPIFMGDVSLVGMDVILRMRIAGAIAIGKLLSVWDQNNEEQLKNFTTSLKSYLSSQFATTRLISCLILEEYARCVSELNKKPSEIITSKFLPILFNSLTNTSKVPMYRELLPFLKATKTQCNALLAIFVENGNISRSRIPQLPVVLQGEAEAGPDAFGVQHAEKVVGEIFDKLKKALSTTHSLALAKTLEDSRFRILTSIDDIKEAQTSRDVAILAAAAAAYIPLAGELPKKLNPIIRSLMDSVKSESNSQLQHRSGKSIANLIEILTRNKKLNIVDKIVKNLCGFLCCDTSEVPEFYPNQSFKENILSLRKDESKTDPIDIVKHKREMRQAKIKRSGGEMTLSYLANMFGDKLFEKVPKLKTVMLDSLELLENDLPEAEKDVELKVAQEVIDALGITRALLPKMDSKLALLILDKIHLIHKGLQSRYSVIRYVSAKCSATLCNVLKSKAIVAFVDEVLPMVVNSTNVTYRQGAVECIYHLTVTMGADILPYIVFLIVPILGRMSDSDMDIRILATTTFASIIKLVPLESGIPDPDDLPTKLLEGREREREFISQMMDVSKVKRFELPVPIKAELRSYQQEGLNWLAFLNKYHLHGILCDDMGLGKTLQTICIVASDHYLRAQEYEKTQSPETRKLPSIIICPPSLTGHWHQELKQYAPFLNVLSYVGSSASRVKYRGTFNNYDVIVTSYDLARNDVEIVIKQDFNYCVLDEGHIIRNASSKLTKSVKRIRAEHRLILSGTPIQNNVLELWSLFDFLMPGFLGNEKLFQEKFAKPIAASRNTSTSSKEQEAGALALEALHKQVLPFMLRRLKEDVLSDLPPKIIQDYYCELSDLQKILYEDFVKKQKATVTTDLSSGEKKDKQHVFQALHYMRKLCNHPALVMKPSHPLYLKLSHRFKLQQGFNDLIHAPKLQALQTLLLDCGIGIGSGTTGNQGQLLAPEEVISQHRALIFCQLKDMLDIVENDLLKKYMPGVTYLRMDGNTEANKRQNIVQKFNADPSIDVLLLTTKVGGLGLNLTGADTVIFVEHDWNPMMDLQAMDRAHRIGQKKVVNVYRLITRNTLEEKIMGLQKFKMSVASAVVNQQNTGSGLAEMDSNQLLDLFDASDLEKSSSDEPKDDDQEHVESSGLGGKAGSAIANLQDLWAESQYEEEYNLDNFIQSLR